MSAKLRLTLWMTVMVLLLAGVVLIYVILVNSTSTLDDPAERLVSIVLNNAADLSYQRDRFEWEDLHVYRRGVSCSFYSPDGALLMAADRSGADSSAVPFEANQIRTVTLKGTEYYLYDTLAEAGGLQVWVRGLVAVGDTSGLMHSITVVTLTLLPVLLILALGGGWLIARDTFRPMEKILTAANSISDGNDLSARIDLKPRRGSAEMLRLSQAFDRMFERLESSFNAERQFASDASHELRTPITVILAACDRARRKAKTPEDYRQTLAVVEEEAQRMSELVQQLLGLTRLQHGTERFPLRLGNLSQLVEACGHEFIPGEDRGIAFSMQIQEDVSARFNAGLISRLVQNLLQNAWKYGRENGHVILSLRAEGDRALLQVTDDGIGIAPENQDRIWQRFWQADASRGADGGTGLGLSMVKEIAELHGGKVSVRSAPGEGSIFTVELPCG